MNAMGFISYSELILQGTFCNMDDVACLDMTVDVENEDNIKYIEFRNIC